MKVEQQAAYLLRTHAFSETSLLVDLFSKGYGRLTVLAKGARRKKSPVRGLLLPFKPLLASWTGKGQLPILTSAEQSQHTAEMSGIPLASGFYLNELLLRLLHRHDAHEDLFEQYHLAIKQLTEGHAPRPVLRIFEKRLLHHIGFGLVFDRDVETGEAICAHSYYRYIIEKGPVGISAEHQVAPISQQANEQQQPHETYAITIRGSTLHALREERFPSANELQEAQSLTRMLLERQLNGHTLRSRTVAMQINRYQTQQNVGKDSVAVK